MLERSTTGSIGIAAAAPLIAPSIVFTAAAMMGCMAGASLLFTAYWGVLIIQYLTSNPMAVSSIHMVPRKKIYQYGLVAVIIVGLIWCSVCAFVRCGDSMAFCIPPLCVCK